jgi:predicted nucleotidyltransferase component of viral defense system
LDLVQIEKIKKLAIIALVSDDTLMEQLVLKGGNAIDLIYNISARASIDLDFSIPGDFEEESTSVIQDKLHKLFKETFEPEGLIVFDVQVIKKPANLKHPDEMKFWGGYEINFKVIPKSSYNNHSGDIESLRKYSTVIDGKDRKVFKIDISKFEYCDDKIAKDVEGYTVFVYTTEMLVIEKIRAICQQHPEYREIVKRHAPNSRARDFFDIYNILQLYPIDFGSERIRKILTACFESKKVPMHLIHKISSQRELHSTGYPSLRDTVTNREELKEFDFYFDFVVKLLDSINV